MGFIRGFYYFWGECDWKKDDPSVRPGPHQCLSNREPRVCMFCDQLEGTEMDKLSVNYPDAEAHRIFWKE